MELRIAQKLLINYTSIVILCLISTLSTVFCRNYNGSLKCPDLLPEYDERPRFKSTNRNTKYTDWKGNSRIIGGTILDAKMLPYLAALFRKDQNHTNKFLCSAVIVGPRTIFTAAHCIVSEQNRSGEHGYGLVEDRFSVVFGLTQISSSFGIRMAVESLVVHPRYSRGDWSTSSYDVAFLTLQKDIPSNNMPMKVNDNENIPTAGSVVRSAGYGVQKFYENSTGYLRYDYSDDFVQHIDIPVTNVSYCYKEWRRDYKDFEINGTTQICTGYLGGGCSTW